MRNRRNMRNAPAGNAPEKNAQASNSEPTAAQMEDAERLMREYGGRSENELMNELISAAAMQRAEGSFDAAGMRKTAELILPMLTPEQAAKLEMILSMMENGA